VSLGKCRELLDADYDAHKLPSGYNSVKGLGKIAPDSAHNHTLYVHAFCTLPSSSYHHHHHHQIYSSPVTK